MKGDRSIQIKAAFLLSVFSLNTLVGFACSVGLKMGSGSSHHGKLANGEIHIHKDGTKHVHKAVEEKNHHNKETNNGIHLHKDGKKHDHNAAAEKNHHAQGSTTSKKDDCCKEKVVKLQTADKNFQYSKTSISAPVFIVPGKYLESVNFKIVEPHLQECIACHFHPPPRDIRIDIQSFQI